MNNQEMLIFYSSKTKLIINFLLLATVATVCGFGMFSAQGGTFWACFVLMVVTGIPACIYLYSLSLKPQKLLEIGPDGIYIFSLNIRHPKQQVFIFVPWPELERAYIFSIGRLSRLALRLHSVENLLSKQTDEKAQKLLRKMVVDGDSLLLTNNIFLQVSDEKLKNIINEQLELYHQAATYTK